MTTNTAITPPTITGVLLFEGFGSDEPMMFVVKIIVCMDIN